MPGVSNVEFAGNRVFVTYDPSRTSLEAIARGIEATGVDEVSKIEQLAGQP